MKKIFCLFGIAAMALSVVMCKPEEKPGPDVNNITEDGFYVVGEATGLSEVTAALTMANGINEANNQTPREGMYEKYIVLQSGKDFTLAYVNGGQQTAYGATLSEFKADLSDPVYDSNPADAVFKGKLVVGDSAPKMTVSKTGLYHIVLDLNKAGDLDDAQIVLCPVTMGVRGGMNSWGFDALEASTPSNDGITFTLSGQEMAAGAEFKFAYNSAWKITLDKEGKVKANTNLGQDCKPGGGNIAVTEGAGAYKITLTYKLAAGDIANSFSYKTELESASSAPETMYMIGQQFGDWKWEDPGVVELSGIPSGVGYFWCTRYFEADKGFKFCSTKAWNGDFTGAGTAGYTVNDGNCWVPADGFYTVFVNGNDNSVEVYPAEVYGIGSAWGNDAWDFNAPDIVKFQPDGKTLKATVTNTGEVRISSKILPSAPIDGLCTPNGWLDWWKTEFIFFDGKIAYRGAGGDQERVTVEAGKTIVLDFNAGTAEVVEGSSAPTGGEIKTAEEFIAWLANPSVDAFLAADINLTGMEFTSGVQSGTFDGKGKTITYNIDVTERIPDGYEGDKVTATQANVGLFKFVTGTVQNLETAGTIKFSAEAGSGTYHIGGIAGLVSGEGKIVNCTNGVNILADTQCTHHIGGIAGFTAAGASVTGCRNTGKVEMIIPDKGTANASQLGGIIGHIEGSGVVDTCTNDGQVTYEGNGTPREGGICGYINNLVDVSFIKCVNNGAIIWNEGNYTKTSWSYVGGLTGYYGTPTEGGKVLYDSCTNNGKVVCNITEEKSKARVGGIACHAGIASSTLPGDGIMTWTFKNCVNNGNISSSSTTASNYLGGIVGYSEVAALLKIEDCVNNGKMEVAGKGTVGGILGRNCSVKSEFTNVKVGSKTVLQVGNPEGAFIGLIAGWQPLLTTAITGKVAGGTIVKGTETIEVSASNFADYLLGKDSQALGEGGSITGVTFGE